MNFIDDDKDNLLVLHDISGLQSIGQGFPSVLAVLLFLHLCASTMVRCFKCCCSKKSNDRTVPFPFMKETAVFSLLDRR